MNCWEFKKCPTDTYEECPAYPTNGRTCWKVTGTKCDKGKLAMASLNEKIDFCRKCDYYSNHAQKY